MVAGEQWMGLDRCGWAGFGWLRGATNGCLKMAYDALYGSVLLIG